MKIDRSTTTHKKVRKLESGRATKSLTDYSDQSLMINSTQKRTTTHSPSVLPNSPSQSPKCTTQNYTKRQQRHSRIFLEENGESGSSKQALLHTRLSERAREREDRCSWPTKVDEGIMRASFPRAGMGTTLKKSSI